MRGNYDSEIENIKLLRLKIMRQVDDATQNVHITRIISNWNWQNKRPHNNWRRKKKRSRARERERERMDGKRGGKQMKNKKIKPRKKGILFIIDQEINWMFYSNYRNFIFLFALIYLALCNVCWMFIKLFTQRAWNKLATRDFFSYTTTANSISRNWEWERKGKDG